MEATGSDSLDWLIAWHEANVKAVYVAQKAIGIEERWSEQRTRHFMLRARRSAGRLDSDWRGLGQMPESRAEAILEAFEASCAAWCKLLLEPLEDGDIIL